MADDAPLYPYVWTAGDAHPGLVFVFRDLQLITDNLTITACIDRPNDVLVKTLTNVDEQKASLTWVKDTDLVAGIGQILTLHSENASGERTHLLRLTLDVREKVC